MVAMHRDFVQTYGKISPYYFHFVFTQEKTETGGRRPVEAGLKFGVMNSIQNLNGFQKLVLMGLGFEQSKGRVNVHHTFHLKKSSDQKEKD